MEALSLVNGVTTIVKLANDITGAVKATSRNKKSCEKLAERVGDIGDLLKGLDSSSPSTVAATRRLVSRLEKALRRALLLVTSCQCQASSRIYSLVAGGWQADQLDKVNAEIDRCLLDLSLSSLALISSVDHKLNAAGADEPNTEVVVVQVAPVAPPPPPVQRSHGHDDGKDKMASGAAEKNCTLICYGEQDGKTETDAAAAGEVSPSVCRRPRHACTTSCRRRRRRRFMDTTCIIATAPMAIVTAPAAASPLLAVVPVVLERQRSRPALAYVQRRADDNPNCCSIT